MSFDDPFEDLEKAEKEAREQAGKAASGAPGAAVRRRLETGERHRCRPGGAQEDVSGQILAAHAALAAAVPGADARNLSARSARQVAGRN